MFKSDNKYIHDYMKGNGVLLEISEKTVYFGYRDLIIIVNHKFAWDYFYNHAQHLPLRDHINESYYSHPKKLTHTCKFIAPNLGISAKSHPNAFDMLNVLISRLDKYQKSRLPQWFVEGFILKKLEE